MIIELLLTVLALGVCLLAIGEFLQEPIWSFIGLFFLFVLGLSVMTGGIGFKTGENEFTQYSYTNTTLKNTTTTTTFVYDSYTQNYGWWFGFLLALGGGFGMSIMFWNLKSVWGKNG